MKKHCLGFWRKGELNVSMAWLKLSMEMPKMQFYCTCVESYSKSKASEYTWWSGNPRTVFQLIAVGKFCPQMNSACILSTACNFIGFPLWWHHFFFHQYTLCLYIRQTLAFQVPAARVLIFSFQQEESNGASNRISVGKNFAHWNSWASINILPSSLRHCRWL